MKQKSYRINIHGKEIIPYWHYKHRVVLFLLINVFVLKLLMFVNFIYLEPIKSRSLHEFYRISKNWSKSQHQKCLTTSKIKPEMTCSRYFCENCGKNYTSMLRVTIHKKNECSKVKPYKCSLCLFRFSENIALRRHFYYKHKVYVPPKNLAPKKIFH